MSPVAIRNVQNAVMWESGWVPYVSEIILASANLYYIFDTVFMYHALYFPLYRFLCYWLHSKANSVNQTIQLCFY